MTVYVGRLTENLLKRSPALGLPAVVQVFQVGTSTPVELFTGFPNPTTGALADAVNDPVTGVARGVADNAPGLDTNGNLTIFGTPGDVDIVADGERFTRQIPFRSSDIATLLGQSSILAAGGILTVGSPVVSSTTSTGLKVVSDFSQQQLVAGAPGYRFSGVLEVDSNSAAGVSLSVFGSSTGADISFQFIGANGATPKVVSGYGGNVAAQTFDNFASGGSKESIAFTGSARVPAGGTTQMLQFGFQQTTANAYATTLLAWHSFCSMRQSTV